MLDDPSNAVDPDPGSTPTLSWQERELVAALKRLANARSQYGVLKAESELEVRSIDEADLDALREAHIETERVRGKTKGRFGAGAARARLVHLEADEQRILDRMGFVSFDEVELWRTDTRPTTTVDPAILEFARRELEDAENALSQLQALQLPEPVHDDGSHDDTSEQLEDDTSIHRPAAS